jgi:hypothetical protein
MCFSSFPRGLGPGRGRRDYLGNKICVDNEGTALMAHLNCWYNWCINITMTVLYQKINFFYTIFNMPRILI